MRPHRDRQVSPSTPVAGALAALGLVGGGLTAWAVATSPILTRPEADALVRSCAIVAFVLGGVYVARRRATDRFGLLLALVGLTYALTTFNASGRESLYSAGRVLAAAWLGLYFYAFLAFPSGRLGTRLERALAGGYALGALLLWPALLVVAEKLPAGGALADCGSECPHNAFRVVSASSSVTRTLEVAVGVLTVAAAVAVALVLVHRARSRTGIERRTVLPVLIAAVAILTSYVAFSLHPAGGLWRDANLVVTGVAALLVPLAFVFSPVRAELFVSRSLWRGLSGLDHSRFSAVQVEEVCRQALGDGSLRLAIATPAGAGFRSADGTPLTLPRNPGPSAITRLERPEGSLAIVHDTSLADGYRPTVERVGELAFTLIQYGRLLGELTLSRIRIAEDEGEERSRLERDLHDGAQQRLVAMRMKLAALEQSVAGSELAHPVGDLLEDTTSAIEELRRLAQGIYPPILLERGLAEALGELPSPPSMSLRVVDNGIGRLPAATERAIYFATLEALQNATKHAGATGVTVTLEPLGDSVEVVVEDDGSGFDAGLVRAGSGLTGIRDRIGAVGGRVEIGSSVRQCTVVRCLVPRNPDHPFAA